MTKREAEILEILNKNPMISQEDIAQRLGIARSSVAIHIGNLISKGYIVGRGYILSEELDEIVVLGGANIDLVGYPEKELLAEDSSPGIIEVHVGGVGRNIAENLANLAQKVHFISALGQDKDGEHILEGLVEAGVGVDYVEIMEAYQTSKYMALLNGESDMAYALSDMRIMDQITVEHLEDKRMVLEQSKLLVADTNLPSPVLAYLAENYGRKLYVDPVSTSKSKRLEPILSSCHFVKPNLIEASLLSGMPIKNEADLLQAGKRILATGVEELLISAGQEGAYYFTGEEVYRALARDAEIKNATGAGDAFLSGFIYGEMNDFSPEEKCRFATASSLAVLKKEESNLQQEDIEEIKNLMEDVKVWKI